MYFKGKLEEVDDADALLLNDTDDDLLKDSDDEDLLAEDPKDEPKSEKSNGKFFIYFNLDAIGINPWELMSQKVKF